MGNSLKYTTVDNPDLWVELKRGISEARARDRRILLKWMNALISRGLASSFDPRELKKLGEGSYKKFRTLNDLYREEEISIEDLEHLYYEIKEDLEVNLPHAN